MNKYKEAYLFTGKEKNAQNARRLADQLVYERWMERAVPRADLVFLVLQL